MTFNLNLFFIKIFTKNVGDVRFYYAIRGFTILLINIHNNIHVIFIFKFQIYIKIVIVRQRGVILKYCKVID